ncbi:MAG: hypothetical protein K2J30_02400 [Clostridia bacterium]|nr:hypothetical protein [Clostridia bacterium]
MKKTALKTVSALLLGITILATLLFGILSMPHSLWGNAEEETVNVSATLKVDDEEIAENATKEILAGDSFTLSAVVATTGGDEYMWGGITLICMVTVKVPQEGGGFADGEATDFITFGDALALEGSFTSFDNSTGYEAMDDGGTIYHTVRFMIANNGLSDVNLNESATMAIKLTVKEGVKQGTQLSFKIDDEVFSGYSSITYDPLGIDEMIATEDSNFTVDDVTVTVRQKSTDNTLSSVVVGTTDTNTQTYSKTDETPLATSISYDYNEATVLSSVNITPTANNEYATIYMAAGSTAPDPDTATPVTSGTATNITLTEGVRVVTVLVKAEDNSTKTYTVTIVDKYVALSALDIQVGTKTEGVTKKGLREGVTFNADTLTYTVDVPGDYADSDTGVKITPTIAEGHGIQEAVALAGTNCSTENNSIASGSSFQVTGISDDGTLTLTVTASDNTTTKVYTITFKVWSVEIGDVTVQVQGQSKTYDSDAEKAEEKKIDYYFLLTDEAECKGKFLITAQDGIPVQVRASSSDTAEDYDKDNPKEYGAGTYYIVLTAPAGNTKECVAVLSKMEFLELAADSTYQFIYEETTGTGNKTKNYLRTYHESKMMHGVDDKDFEKVVLGNIAPKTTINTFLSNISPSQLGMIRIYNNKGQLLYDCGADIEGIDKANYDKWSKYRISTSWYVQYGGTAENPLETVYISVLGDTSCNGVIDAADTVKISAHISKKKLIEDLEVRLAAYVNNNGTVAAKDVTILNQIITLKKDIESYLYKIETTEPTTATTGE